jgi:methyl-accepting chemotaxis protein
MATRQVVSSMKSIGETIRKTNEIATAIAAAVEEQSAATSEIARNVQAAATGATEVSGNVGAVHHLTGEADTAAREVLAASNALAEQIRGLRDVVERFVTQIQAA